MLFPHILNISPVAQQHHRHDQKKKHHHAGNDPQQHIIAAPLAAIGLINNHQRLAHEIGMIPHTIGSIGKCNRKIRVGAVDISPVVQEMSQTLERHAFPVATKGLAQCSMQRIVKFILVITLRGTYARHQFGASPIQSISNISTFKKFISRNHRRRAISVEVKTTRFMKKPFG